ncbi:maleylpyruvate isomerase N-terminal domain-containing protein [Kitasatospora purpeofusca]|uniref:maleylpyruvate isomerase N-terminal domain-containing protein n=1 Tax=Kitasatospora purpeofusca TaxID=67352 RepID=UPI00386ABE22|nr:maleylpyruvate isomerase N-terminal domain-containing protein [Kitasatospora purpeofusca]
MQTTLDFPDLLRLIDERATAFRAAVAAAPDLGAQVPTCPDWTLLDLVRHLGEGRRNWGIIVAAGPSEVRPDTSAALAGPAVPPEREALIAWLAESTRQLLDALREAGPDSGCWTWWPDSQAPQTAGAVARHQLQEITVHTYDAQLVAGTAQPLPEEVAVDGVDEFMFTCVATKSAWPHEPAIVDYHATEGRSWRLRLDAEGALIARIPAPGTPGSEELAPADFSATATAAELVLAVYDRYPLKALKVEGDGRIFEQLAAWDPSA